MMLPTTEFAEIAFVQLECGLWGTIRRPPGLPAGGLNALLPRL